jgi:endonuclease YncB( thermonuclease family)
MRPAKSTGLFLACVAGVLAGWALAGDPTPRRRPPPEDPPAAPAKAAEPPAPAKGAAEESPPPENQLYLWPLPERGRQTVLVLRVLDGDTAEVAYLVPAVCKLKGIVPPDPQTKEGKAAADAFQKLIGGRLLPASLAGRDQYGRVVADFWLGPKAGDEPGGWAAARMIRGGFGKKETSPAPPAGKPDKP